LPLHHIKPDSNAKEIEFFKKYGFIDLTTTLMEDADMHRKEQKGKTLLHKLVCGNYDEMMTYCLNGRKPMKW